MGKRELEKLRELLQMIDDVQQQLETAIENRDDDGINRELEVAQTALTAAYIQTQAKLARGAREETTA